MEKGYGSGEGGGAFMSSTNYMKNDKRAPPHNTTFESRESLIPEPRSTPSSTLTSTVSNSWVLIRNC